jgi:predicted dehydrogenase
VAVEQIQPVRIGLVGYGKGGRFFHAPLIFGSAGCELAGVVTRSAERRGELERDYPGTPAYDDLAQLAAAGVDAVAAHHAGGVVSHLVGDLLLHGAPGNRFRVFGTRGSYDVDDFDGQADELMAGGSPAASGPDWGVVPPEHWGSLHRDRTTRPWPSERGDWTVFYSSFACAVRGLGAVPVDPWDAVAGLEVLEAAQRSAATGQVVALGRG